MHKRPTIQDVARHAGVSKSTVSLVLQNSPLVKGSTRKQVEASMAALNYVYNRSAANLRGAGTGLVGLIINACSGRNGRPAAHPPAAAG
jgi:LacI family transcriptional regulator